MRFTHVVPSFSSGRNSLPSRPPATKLKMNAATATESTRCGCVIALRSSGSYLDFSHSTRRLSPWSMCPLSRRAQSSGTSVSERTSEPTSAEVTVQAIGEKMRPSWRCSVKIGMCAAMMMIIENTVGRPTS